MDKEVGSDLGMACGAVPWSVLGAPDQGAAARIGVGAGIIDQIMAGRAGTAVRRTVMVSVEVVDDAYSIFVAVKMAAGAVRMRIHLSIVIKRFGV